MEHSAAGSADGVEPVGNGAAADKPGTSTRSHKSSDSAAKANSAAKPAPTDIMSSATETASALHEPTPVDTSVASQTSDATDRAGEPQAGQQLPATNADDGSVGVAQEEAAPWAAIAAADNGTGEEAAVSAAFAEVEVASKEAEAAAFADACKAGQGDVAAQAEAEQPKQEAQEEQAQAQELKEEAPEELIEAMDEDKAHSVHQPSLKKEEGQKLDTAEMEKAAQPAAAGQAEAAKEDNEQQASPMDTATAVPSGSEKQEKGASDGDGRGVKRPPAPAVVRAAKQARTNQAAGECSMHLS